MGIVSDALPTFCRRPLVGYTAVALSTMATMLVGFEVWVHHMFATGLPTLALSFFGAASMVISIPSAIATFAWIATIWGGRPVFKVPFYFFAGFVLLFVVGGVSGVLTAAVSLDWQLTETYFIIAHMHYVLLGINVFPVIGGIYYWFPKFTGRMTGQRFGTWIFWIMFIGFNMAFFPMHIAGLLGMPRRIYTYSPDMGWNMVNMIISVGSFVFAFGVLLFLVDIFLSWRRGIPAGNNPWDAPTLEWSVPSPPPSYNFAVIPIIASRHPLWEDRLNEGQERSRITEGYKLAQGRKTMATTALDAKPDAILTMPEDSYAPFFLGLFATALFTALLLHSWILAGAMALACALTLMVWQWPSPMNRDNSNQSSKGVGWWGVWTLIVTESSLFGYLLLSYFYLNAQTEMHWPPEGMPKLLMPGINTIILLSSSVFVWLAERKIRAGGIRNSLFFSIVAIVLGAVFVIIQLKEWHAKAYGITSNLYGSLYFTVTGFHMAHVIVGLVILLLLALWTRRGYFTAGYYTPVRIGGLYWHFVDAVWLFVFSSFYLFPYVQGK